MRRAGQRDGIDVDEAAALAIAAAGRSNARDSLQLFRACRDEAQSAGVSSITAELVAATGSAGTCSVVVDVNNTLCLIGLELCADCDQDGRVTVLDAHAMARIGAGLTQEPAPGSDQFNACNVAGAITPSPGARIGAVDALVVARYVVGLDQPYCCLP